MTSNWKPPFPNAYWVVPGQILAGEYPGSKVSQEAIGKIHGLLSCGIRGFINLMEPGELDRYGKVFSPYEPVLQLLAQQMGIHTTTVQFPIPDMDVPSLKTMSAILGHIEWARASERPVYLHCLAGLGRTGTVVGCWMIRQGLARRENVLDRIQRLRRHCENAWQASPQSDVQRQMVLHWPE